MGCGGSSLSSEAEVEAVLARVPLFALLNMHALTHITSWCDPASVRRLRGTCRRAVAAFDIAAGWGSFPFVVCHSSEWSCGKRPLLLSAAAPSQAFAPGMVGFDQPALQKPKLQRRPSTTVVVELTPIPEHAVSARGDLTSRLRRSGAAHLVLRQVAGSAAPVAWLPHELASSMGSLVRLDIVSMPHLESIGDCVAYRCLNLTHLTIAEVPRLRRIGAKLAFGCRALSRLAIADAPQLEVIGAEFVGQMGALNIALRLVELHTLLSLRELGAGAFSGCSQLRGVTFGAAIETVGAGFALVPHRAQPPVDVRIIGRSTVPDSFVGGELGHATCLPDPPLPSPEDPPVTSPTTASNRRWLDPAASFLDAPATKLVAKGSALYVDGADVESATIALCMGRVTLMRSHAPGLQVLAHPLGTIERLPQGFLSRFDRLVNVRLSRMPQLVAIGANFAAPCSQLRRLSIDGCGSLLEVGSNFCEGCKLLTSAAIDAPRLEDIGPGMFSRCTALRRFDLSYSRFPMLLTLGAGAFRGCNGVPDGVDLPRNEQGAILPISTVSRAEQHYRARLEEYERDVRVQLRALHSVVVVGNAKLEQELPIVPASI
jgi:hypothetical protein